MDYQSLRNIKTDIVTQKRVNDSNVEASQDKR